MGATQSRLQAWSAKLAAVRTTLRSPALYVSASGLSTTKMMATLSRALGFTPAHFRFLDLPPEIRNMIYAELVVVGKVIYKPDVPSGFRKPELALLRVCKQSHQEAESLYLSKNLFVLPVNFNELRPFCDSPEGSCPAYHKDPSYLFSRAGFKFIKNISVRFDKAQLGCLYYSDVWDDYEVKYSAGPNGAMASVMRDIHIKSKQDDHTYDRYTQVQLALTELKRAMDYVEVDFTEAFCVGGFHRSLEYCVCYWILSIRPQNVVVTGLRRGEEHRFLSSVLLTINGAPKTLREFEQRYGVHIEFKGKDDADKKWDAYRVADV